MGRPASIEDVPKPSPGPGQVLIKISGAGVCRSDLHVMEEDALVLDCVGVQPTVDLGGIPRGFLRRSLLKPSALFGGSLTSGYPQVRVQSGRECARGPASPCRATSGMTDSIAADTFHAERRLSA